ncbi:MAG: hypothetical protein ACLTDX_06190 [[Clostridium] innocuum]
MERGAGGCTNIAEDMDRYPIWDWISVRWMLDNRGDRLSVTREELPDTPAEPPMDGLFMMSSVSKRDDMTVFKASVDMAVSALNFEMTGPSRSAARASIS